MECEKEGIKVVQSWSFKDPSDDTNSAKISWSTYNANIQREGDVFVSRSNGKQYSYHWMEDM
jgi:hypothetical protein